MKTVFHQFLLLLFFLSWVFNFPVIDNPSLAYEQFGGYFSWPLLRALDSMFGSQPMAIKSFVLILMLCLIGRILYSHNVSLPSMSVRLLHEQAKTSKSSSKTKASGSLLQWGITAKVKAATNKSKLPLIGASSQPGWVLGKTWSDKSLLKDILKNNISKKVNDTMHEKNLMKIDFPADKPTYPISLMPSSSGKEVNVDETFLIQNAKALQNKLMEFNVPVTIDGFDIWPSIVQVRVRPDSWIKVSTIENLKNDIALSMKTKSLRIISPIPGTDCVGIQIPNPQPRMVYLADVFNSHEFAKWVNKNLTNLALWVGIDGTNIVKSLEEMPHLLIAWATGAGKSVWVNGMILSLMYQNTPAELKFLMVDPKQVELEFYNGLPYLLAPIVTRPAKALKLLQWAVEEMEARYTKLKKAKAKKLSEYNTKNPDDFMYRIVIVVDELADLMMSGNKKEVETCITRIAQKARAVGMHLIIATQRPSVNVLTGLIKANIPTRVAFGVVSQIDSRTILGMKGAEDLVGKGDLLYLDTKTKYPVRMQWPFVDTPEIEKIMEALKEKYMQWLTEEDVYHPEIVRILEWKAELSWNVFSSNNKSGDEELIQKAMELIIQHRKASATMLQRKLNVWFARAARIMDALEERWVVWPQEWAKPRQILI